MTMVSFIREIVKRALKEDVGAGDVTTVAIVPAKSKAKAKIYALEKGVVTGLDAAKEVFRQLDRNVKIRGLVRDGAKVRANQALFEIKGRARALLTGERTALNFLQHLSGIATLTRKYVEAVKLYKVKILDTRKTVPGMRMLEKYAVRMGGGHNHRMGLYDMVMIKDNHLRISSQLADDSSQIKEMIRIRKKIPRMMKVEVEAKNLKEVRVALEAGADVIMLDNMNLTMMKRAVKFITTGTRPTFAGAPGGASLAARKRPIIEASGKVTIKNVRAIARTGVDWISIGRLTHSAPALDISMEIIDSTG